MAGITTPPPAIIPTDASRAWPREMSADTIKLLLATAPVVKEHGTAITSTMYGIMFSEFPQVKNLFNMNHHRVRTEEGASVSPQATSLANAVIAFAANCDKLGNLTEAVARMVHKHVSLHVLPEHYPIVGGCLLRAIKKVLGDAATDEIMAAWADGYWFLADLLIAAENDYRAELVAIPGGWYGFRDLLVARKVRESAEITSFYLTSTDDKPLVGFKPGMYLSLKFDHLQQGHDVVRNYSISSEPGLEHYRITVKRDGLVSKHLHDEVQEGQTLQVGPPCGHFFLQDELAHKPLVLLSGGVGLTPLLSMLESLVESGKVADQPVVFVQYVRSRDVLSFHKRLSELASQHETVTYRVVCGDAESEEEDGVVVPGGKFDLAKLEAWLPTRESEFYFCGPAGFMTAVNRALADEWQVPSAQRHFEYFGPTQDIDAPLRCPVSGKVGKCPVSGQ